ncbi:MAG: hypothetical protein OXC46_08430 [Thaumarchaeota archaeon]|nr:hypothetical protein [Nitrososphaerota archaeon]
MEQKHHIGVLLLREELEKMLSAAGITRRFDVQWRPKHDSKIEGKVEDRKYDTMITIYSEDIGTAMDTLRHELVDYIISDAIKPYLKAINALLSVIGEVAYQRKEQGVESLLRLLDGKMKR